MRGQRARSLLSVFRALARCHKRLAAAMLSPDCSGAYAKHGPLVQVSQEPPATAYPTFSCSQRKEAAQRVHMADALAADARAAGSSSDGVELVGQLVGALHARFRAPPEGQPCTTAWLKQLEIDYAAAMRKLARQHQVWRCSPGIRYVALLCTSTVMQERQLLCLWASAWRRCCTCRHTSVCTTRSGTVTPAAHGCM